MVLEPLQGTHLSLRNLKSPHCFASRCCCCCWRCYCCLVRHRHIHNHTTVVEGNQTLDHYQDCRGRLEWSQLAEDFGPFQNSSNYCHSIPTALVQKQHFRWSCCCSTELPLRCCSTALVSEESSLIHFDKIILARWFDKTETGSASFFSPEQAHNIFFSNKVNQKQISLKSQYLKTYLWVDSGRPKLPSMTCCDEKFL